MADNDKITRTPVVFRPFPNWTGPRKGVSSTVNSETERAVVMLPVPTKQVDMKALYNLTLVQFCEIAVSGINYKCDSPKDGSKKWFNDKMRDGQCELIEVHEQPPNALWFIEKKESKVAKGTETTSTQAETGWTHDEMIEYMKKHPKAKT